MRQAPRHDGRPKTTPEALTAAVSRITSWAYAPEMLGDSHLKPGLPSRTGHAPCCRVPSWIDPWCKTTGPDSNAARLRKCFTSSRQLPTPQQECASGQQLRATSNDRLSDQGLTRWPEAFVIVPAAPLLRVLKVHLNRRPIAWIFQPTSRTEWRNQTKQRKAVLANLLAFLGWIHADRYRSVGAATT